MPSPPYLQNLQELGPKVIVQAYDTHSAWTIRTQSIRKQSFGSFLRTYELMHSRKLVIGLRIARRPLFYFCFELNRIYAYTRTGLFYFFRKVSRTEKYPHYCLAVF